MLDIYLDIHGIVRVVTAAYRDMFFFCLSKFCDREIVKNNKNEHLWSLNSQKHVIFLQEV